MTGGQTHIYRWREGAGGGETNCKCYNIDEGDKFCEEILGNQKKTI
jgi:hypothetical protein